MADGDGDVLEVDEVHARLPCAAPRACAACVFSPMYVYRPHTCFT